MTNQEKGERYDSLLQEGYYVQNEISRLKTDISKQETAEYKTNLANLERKLSLVEAELEQLGLSA